MMAYGLTEDQPVSRFQPCDYVFKIAKSTTDLSGFWRLRRQVFCAEQGVFDETDRDQIDRTMIPIVCATLLAGMEDRVIGVVRIDERAPGVWWGSRLCVHRDFRRLRTVSPGVAIRNRQPGFFAKRSIGAGLIYKAVSTAHGLGCHTFHAHVQQQNAAFFRRLHWQVLEHVELHGMPHVKMQADLAYYPPAESSVSTALVA